tara:strand:- start:395 stop:553 length:159 start_codon:yes stop_codon:yes gene_type:complete
MAEYAILLKGVNTLVFKAQSNSLEEAKEYFRKLKQMSKEDFNNIFVVVEVKK